MPLSASRAAVVEAAKASDVALSFEAIGRERDLYRATPGRRGSSGWSLKVDAKPGHALAVFSPEAGYGAIYEAARILDAFRRELHEDALTFNPGIAVGGSTAQYDESSASATAYGKVNVIAARMQVQGDLRYVDHAQHDRALRRMREIVAENLPQTHASIAFEDYYPPMPVTSDNLSLLAAYSKVSVDAGMAPVEATSLATRGSGDIQFAAPYAASLDSLGTNGRGSHSDEEQMELASVERGAIRAALMIHRLTRP